jgi:hypothetical protein
LITPFASIFGDEDAAVVVVADESFLSPPLEHAVNAMATTAKSAQDFRPVMVT